MLGSFILISFLAYADGFRIVCYYTNTAQYRPDGGKFLPEDIVPQLCTHIVYAYATPTGLGMGATDENDISTSKGRGMYARVVEIRQQNPDIKILLSLAGPNNDTHPYTPILATSVSRSAFAHNAIAFLRKYGFDGLEVSWRYPNLQEKPVLNRDKFVLFFKELRQVFTVDGFMRKSPSLLLAAVLPGIQEDIESDYDIEGILGHTDYVSLVTFDYRMSINTLMLHNPFHAGLNQPFGLESSVHYLKELKVPRDKLNIGISLSGSTYSLNTPSDTNIGSRSAGLGKPGPITQREGFLAYYEVCELIKNNATIVNQSSQDVRTLSKDNLWVSYEDVPSVITKACFARDNELGGVMVRSLDLDDFTGKCCGQGRYPLMTAIESVIRDSTCRKCGITLEATSYTRDFATDYTIHTPLLTRRHEQENKYGS